MPPPPAAITVAPKLLTRDFDYLYTGCAHLSVRERITRIADDNTGREGDDVITVIPLLALGLEFIATCRNGVELEDALSIAEQIDI